MAQRGMTPLKEETTIVKKTKTDTVVILHYFTPTVSAKYIKGLWIQKSFMN